MLKWSGVPGEAFVAITQTSSGTGTLTIPGANFATSFANRLFVPYALGQRIDSILVSDILDYTRYVPQINQFRINFGTSDDIVAISPFGLTTLVIFKGASISYLRNVYGDLSNVAAAELTREKGLVAPKAIAQVGSFLWFLSRTGVYRMTVTPGDDKIVLDPLTLSYVMQPFFDQVNWANISQAVMSADSERVYISLPFGSGATTNNAVAVYNHLTEQWEGYDTFTPSVDCQSLLRLSYLGKYETWWIDRSGRILITGVNFGQDRWNATDYGISDEVITRGYYTSPSDRRSFRYLGVILSTFNPTYTITAYTDRTQSDVVISATSPSRTQYSIFSKATYTLTNTNDDHDAVFRGDYRVLVSDNFHVKTGALIELTADVIERGIIRTGGHTVQIGIANTGGYVSLMGASVEARESDRQVTIFN